jgi:putative selenium metabolism hydrolase
MAVDRFGGVLKAIAFEQVLDCIQGLIEMQTLSGQEEKIVKHLIRTASRLGFTNAYSDRMGNLIVEMVVGSGEGPRIVLTGHLDTVSVNPAEWDAQTRPFTGSVVNGRLYGRGAADMKASFAVMLHAAASLAGLKGPFNGRVYVVGTVVEELFEGVCFLEALKKLRPDIVIVGEATEGRINIGQRGRAEIVFTVYGEPQHASTGRKVMNAIEQVAYIIDAFHVWYRSDGDEVLGKRNIVPTDIKIPIGGGGGLDGRGGNSTVPNRVELTYDIRTLAGDTEESILRLVRENIDRVVQNGRKRYPQYKVPTIQFSSERAVTWTGEPIVEKKFAPAWKTARKSDLVLKAMTGFEKGTGKKPQLGSYGFCTDGSGVVRYRELFPDRRIEVIGYGPGSEKAAHTVNESIGLEEIKEAYAGFQGILLALLA